MSTEAAERRVFSFSDVVLDDRTEWMGLVRECPVSKPGRMAFIHPSTHDGFFWGSVYDFETMTSMKRPVTPESLRGWIDYVGFSVADASPWIAKPSKRHAAPPMDTPARNPAKGDVYFIRAECGGPIKIGTSHTAEFRMRDLQSGSPFKLVLLAVTSGGYVGEAALHRRFAASRLHGEWFEPTHELLTLIEEIRSEP